MHLKNRVIFNKIAFLFFPYYVSTGAFFAYLKNIDYNYIIYLSTNIIL